MERLWKKTDKRGKKFWGILGALWLTILCVAGCAAPIPEADSKGEVNRQVSETWETLTSAEREEEASPEEESGEEEASLEEESGEEETLTVDESGSYTTKDEVALYLHLYGHLPDNYITKKEAEDLGWDSKAGNLWEVAPGASIGGSRFGNYEGLLPDKDGRKYYECDIDYDGGYRGAKRIIYSDDGLIFYTEDHYKTFEELYGYQED